MMLHALHTVELLFVMLLTPDGHVGCRILWHDSESPSACFHSSSFLPHINVLTVKPYILLCIERSGKTAPSVFVVSTGLSRGSGSALPLAYCRPSPPSWPTQLHQTFRSLDTGILPHTGLSRQSARRPTARYQWPSRLHDPPFPRTSSTPP
jgi:hypothetical protein